jgi:hypothetical protein
VINIDISKSYDRVRWLYIKLLLTHLGFELPFINWIMSYITIVSFAVFINGVTSPLFHDESGLRQGLPWSPLLFLLVVEGINKAIGEEKSRGDFQGISISTTLNLTHLLFVEDVLIFCNGKMGDADKLRCILDIFRKVTRMKINDHKSTLSIHNMEEVELICY